MNASSSVGRRSSRAIRIPSATPSRTAITSIPSIRSPEMPYPFAFFERSVWAEWRSTEVPIP